MIKAVIFDYDGVIANTVPLNIKARDMVLKYYGVRMTKKEVDRFIGTSLFDKLRYVNKKYKANIDFEEFSKKYVVIKKRLFKSIKSRRGVKKIIDDLKTNEIKIGIATSNIHQMLNKDLKTMGLAGVFDSIVTSEDIKKNKPDPQIYLATAKKLKVKPKNCVVIEDAINGIISAKRAKMKVVAYLTPYQSKKIMKGKSDLAVSSFNSLNWQKIKSL